MYDISVVIIVFNRFDETKLLLNKLSEIQPKRLFVVGDGPRKGNEKDRVDVLRVRELFDSNHINWDCDVQTNFSDENLGCQQRVSSGLDWAFSLTDKAIILEDDCIPNVTFFDFCCDNLIRYYDDKRVMSISGTRLAPPSNLNMSNFSKYSICWGWATWDRAWKKFDYDMEGLDQLIKSDFFKYLFNSRRAHYYWNFIFNKVKCGGINSWAYRWMLSCWREKGYSLVPPVNLITNIGYGDNATHTTNVNKFLNTPSFEMEINQNQGFVVDYKMDEWIEDNFYSKSLYQRIKWAFNRLLRNG